MIDSKAIAVTNPSCRSEVSIFDVPKSIIKKAIMPVTNNAFQDSILFMFANWLLVLFDEIKISKLSAIALICSDIYGIIPTTHTNDTNTPNEIFLP